MSPINLDKPFAGMDKEFSMGTASRLGTDVRLATPFEAATHTVPASTLLPPPPEDPVLRYFKIAALEPYAQIAAKPFLAMAEDICATVLPSDERTRALRKLLESRDCVIRCVQDRVASEMKR